MLSTDDETPSGGSRTSKQVPADIWRELAQKVSGVFDSVTIRDLCSRGEQLGINRGDGNSHMYFI